jgi:hypothetical protein
MFLKNYTSNVPVSETLYRIEKVLIRCGVSGITKEYGPNSEVIAVKFHIHINPESPEFTIRLPADKEKALDALWLDYVGEDKVDANGRFTEWNCRKKKKRADFAQQAERTAWKIIQDWVEVQMSMIQTRQAEFTEVFMPYIFDGNQTVYQRVKSGNLRMLLPAPGDTEK